MQEFKQDFALGQWVLSISNFYIVCQKYPEIFLTFSPIGWEFLAQFSHAYYMLLSMLELYSATCNFDKSFTTIGWETTEP